MLFGQETDQSILQLPMLAQGKAVTELEHSGMRTQHQHLLITA